MPSNRYDFFQDETQTLTLVFDDLSNQWVVEVSGPQLMRTRFPLETFEKSEDAVAHAERLMEAIGRAAQDEKRA